MLCSCMVVGSCGTRPVPACVCASDLWYPQCTLAAASMHVVELLNTCVAFQLLWQVGTPYEGGLFFLSIQFR
jgi:hypothetical protein